MDTTTQEEVIQRQAMQIAQLTLDNTVRTIELEQARAEIERLKAGEQE